jgi:hypothetical protein
MEGKQVSLKRYTNTDVREWFRKTGIKTKLMAVISFYFVFSFLVLIRILYGVRIWILAVPIFVLGLVKINAYCYNCDLKYGKDKW